MAKQNTDHVVLDMRTGNLLCEHCGGTYRIELPAPIDMWAAQGKVFTKQHRACKKVWSRPPAPVVDGSLTQEERINWWLANGERGISSNTMLEVITGRTCTSGAFGRSYPRDPDDFKRCWKLVQAVPELREGFPKLAEENAVWAKLLEHWDELADMMPAVVDEWAKAGKRGAVPLASKMYERMKQMGC